MEILTEITMEKQLPLSNKSCQDVRDEFQYHSWCGLFLFGFPHQKCGLHRLLNKTHKIVLTLQMECHLHLQLHYPNLSYHNSIVVL